MNVGTYRGKYWTRPGPYAEGRDCIIVTRAGAAPYAKLLALIDTQREERVNLPVHDYLPNIDGRDPHIVRL